MKPDDHVARARRRDRALQGTIALVVSAVLAGACETSSSSGTGGSIVALDGGDDAATLAACEACVATECEAEAKACSEDCFDIQACIDSVCFNLSATSAPTEGDCQVYCQSLHSAGRAAHLAWVSCAQSQAPAPDGGGSCLPPCLGAPLDFDACVAAATVGACATAAAACHASSDCTSYVACASACTTSTDCEACATSTDGVVGEPLYEALQRCLAHACLALEWVPHE